jgi:hypothetical protein
MRPITKGFLFPILATVAACGPSTPHDLFVAKSDALCSAMARCGVIGQSELAQCKSNGVDFASTYAQTELGYDMDAAISAGRLSIDGSAANSCVAATRDAPCNAVQPNTFVGCEHIFVGHVPLGSSCGSDAECTAGFCQRSNSGTCGGICTTFAVENASCASLQCDRTKNFCDSAQICRARGAVGAACKANNQDADCQDGLGCNGVSCQKPAAAGEPCAATQLGTTSGCQSGLHCVITADTPVCAANVAAGQACSDALACPDGHRCLGLSGHGGSGTCTPILDVGAACDPMADACPFDSPCDSNGHTCTLQRPFEGADCSGIGGSSTCYTQVPIFTAPLYCDSTTLRCTRQRLPGQSCDPSKFDPQCYTSCDGTTATCTAPTSCF